MRERVLHRLALVERRLVQGRDMALARALVQHGYSHSSVLHGPHSHRATSAAKQDSQYDRGQYENVYITLALNVWSFWDRYSSLLWSGFPLLYPHSKV